MERLEFDLLFRWFVGLSADAPAWDHSTFSKNRDRLLDGAVAVKSEVGAVSRRPRTHAATLCKNILPFGRRKRAVQTLAAHQMLTLVCEPLTSGRVERREGAGQREREQD